MSKKTLTRMVLVGLLVASALAAAPTASADVYVNFCPSGPRSCENVAAVPLDGLDCFVNLPNARPVCFL